MGILSGLTLGSRRPLRVAAYCRVSTEEELQSRSYESQREFFSKEIREHPQWQLTAIYGDRAKSGTSVESRPGFKRMLRHAEAGTIDYIITKSISRFSRSTTDTILTLRKLKDLGVGVYFLEQNIDTLSDVGQMVIETLATIAEMESVSISQNLKLALDAMNEKGCPLRKCAYGYEKKGLEWHVVPCEAFRIKLMFLMAAEGYTFTEISNRLDELEEKEHTGKKWNSAMIKRALTNEVYAGDILTNKKVVIWNGTEKKLVSNDGLVDQYYIKNHHEPLIGRQFFDCIRALCLLGKLAGQNNFNRNDSKELQNARTLSRRDFNLDCVRKLQPNVKGRYMR